MNICFFSGNIISDIEFQFIINDKNNISICYFNLKLSNCTIIKVIAYNEMADFCYGKLQRNDLIFLEGHLNYKGEVLAKNVNKVT